MLLTGILLMAKPALADSYYPYEIQGYDVTVKVGKDNVYHVTERLQVNFNPGETWYLPRHTGYQ